MDLCLTGVVLSIIGCVCLFLNRTFQSTKILLVTLIDYRITNFMTNLCKYVNDINMCIFNYIYDDPPKVILG